RLGRPVAHHRQHRIDGNHPADEEGDGQKPQKGEEEGDDEARRAGEVAAQAPVASPRRRRHRHGLLLDRHGKSLWNKSLHADGTHRPRETEAAYFTSTIQETLLISKKFW